EKEDGAWMRTHPSYTDGINAAAQAKNPSSVLNFWRNILKIRKNYSDFFVHGAFEEYDMQNEHTFIFGKRHGGARAIVVLNFTDKEQVFKRPPVGGKWEFLVGNVDGL